jgi:hypothetical protein
MAALSATRNILLLDSRLRGNDEANGLFWFKNREFNSIQTVLVQVLKSYISLMTSFIPISPDRE